MTALDNLYLDLLNGIINQETYDKAVVAYHNIPEEERGQR